MESNMEQFLSSRQLLLSKEDGAIRRRATNLIPGTIRSGCSVLSGTFVMANTILGAGILGLPHAYAECGYAIGAVLLLISAGLSCSGLLFLSKAADFVGRPASFYKVVEKALPGCAPFVDLVVFIKCFGVATSYLIVVGDTMPDVMVGWGRQGILCDRHFWILAALCFAGPLALMQNLSGLRYSSFVAVACMLFVVLTVVVCFWQPLPDLEPYDPTCTSCAGEVVDSTTWHQSLNSLPVFIFSFTCHQNIISITNELAIPTSRSKGIVCTASVFIALVFYLTIATTGYFTFGSLVQSDILQSYSSKTILPDISRVAVACVVTCCYPLQIHPARSSVLSSIRALTQDRLNDVYLWWLLTVAFLFASCAIALKISDLSIVLSFVGATGSVTVQYIIPGASYFLLHSGETSLIRVLSFGQLTVGLVVLSGFVLSWAQKLWLFSL